jgi:hypothetical protein
MAVLWVAFCLLVGWAAAVLLLYGIGMVVGPLVIAALAYFGWRWHLIPEGMLGFGAGMSLSWIPFLSANLPYLHDPLLVVLAIAGMAAGPLMLIGDALLLIRRMRRGSS